MRSRATLLALVVFLGSCIGGTCKAQDRPEDNGLTKDERELEAKLSQSMTYYYKNPNPQVFFEMLRFLDRKQELDDADMRFTMATLGSYIFALNAGKVGAWIDSLPAKSKWQNDVIWMALWYADTPQCTEELRRLCKSATGEERGKLQSLLDRPHAPFIQQPMNSPAVLDALWAGFLVTGDTKYVERVIQAIPRLGEDRENREDTKKDYGYLVVGAAARWSVASNARQHDIVLNYLKRRNQTVSDHATPELKEILADIEKEKGKAEGVPAEKPD